MAVLEAFVYDPLINWRLVAPGGGQQLHGETEEDGRIKNTEVIMEANSIADAGPARALKEETDSQSKISFLFTLPISPWELSPLDKTKDGLPTDENVLDNLEAILALLPTPQKIILD